MPAAPADFIRAAWRSWEPYEPRLERDVFGTIDPVEVIQLVDDFCRRGLGFGVASYEFYRPGVGSTHGVRLDDGRRVVVKVHRASVDRRHLTAAQRAQAHLAAAGFPAPRPVLGPSPLAKGVAVVEELLDAGSRIDAHDPPARRLVATGLARQIDLCRELDLPGLQSTVAVMQQLWRVPHDSRFDFPGTADGAGWIHGLAAVAESRIVTGDGDGEVIGHNDWRVEHLRAEDGTLTSVWDWDSLGVGPETLHLGFSAHCFTADYEVDDVPLLPTLEEALAFIGDYEESRGTPFDDDERANALAALVWATSYSARCEHADALTEMGSAPPTAPPSQVPSDSYRGFLALHGAQLLGIDQPDVPGVADMEW